jgi:hypothetical protein
MFTSRLTLAVFCLGLVSITDDARAAHSPKIESGFEQHAYIKSSNPDSGDEFGLSVAISADTMVVGAFGEKSKATGINGDQTNDSSNDAGAVYVFTRNGTEWRQQAYLKASNTDDQDWFGHSVDISGDSVVIGARFEDSSATGVNGEQDDNTKFNSGATYIFARSSDQWSQQAYLKASNTEQGDGFGWSVSISRNSVTIGAAGEESGASGINGDQADNSKGSVGAVYAFDDLSAKQNFSINSGLNDAWYDPDTDGQGFFITVFPDLGYVSLAWFTYDTELPPEDATANLGDAGHRWLTALGPIDGNQVMMNIDIASGGIFDTATDIQHTDPPGSDGTIVLTFDSCNSATVEYDIPSINRQGTVPIRRVADDNIVLCEALNAD